MAIDKFGRPFLKLRYIVNDECNFFCIFCHFEGQHRRQGAFLTAEDYGFITPIFISLGVRDFKITGGEPLLRPDLDKIVKSITENGGVVSITTNGYLLRKWLPKLERAGVKRLNVSLHTPDPERYGKITGMPPNVFKEVVYSLYESRKAGIDLKINAVVLRDVNTDRESVKRLVKLASELNASLQFIELMPSGLGIEAFSQFYEPIESIVEIVERLGGRPTGLRRELHHRPLYVLGGVVIELIKNFNNPTFCSGCTTMRLTSDGKLKTCIYAEPSVDLTTYIKKRDREGAIYAINTALGQREPRFKLYSS
ncbi:MAG: GTP 3',8-cyclase MoaA [Pyrobaculum sp.]